MNDYNIWEDCIGSIDYDFWNELEAQEEIASYEN